MPVDKTDRDDEADPLLNASGETYERPRGAPHSMFLRATGRCERE